MGAGAGAIERHGFRMRASSGRRGAAADDLAVLAHHDAAYGRVRPSRAETASRKHKRLRHMIFVACAHGRTYRLCR
jgi:hypothetical protein